MHQSLSTRLRYAATVIVAFAVLAWWGIPALFDALVPIVGTPWPASLPPLEATMAVALMVSAALAAPGVYRGLLADDARNREMFLRSITITGRLPVPMDQIDGGGR